VGRPTGAVVGAVTEEQEKETAGDDEDGSLVPDIED
jgi:hypothetical protein